MRLPQSVLALRSKPTRVKAKEVVTLSTDGDSCLEEFGFTEFGNQAQCYVAVAPGDTMSISYEIPSSQAEIVDLIVDGILRESAINSRFARIHQGTFAKACRCERVSDSKIKGRVRHCLMVVQDRTETSELAPAALSAQSALPSAVGTIEIRILRKIPDDKGSSKGALLDSAVRGPTFEQSDVWWNISQSVEAGIIAPKYEIGFVNGLKPPANSRKRIGQDATAYYLFASLKYLYRSASDLRAAGFNFKDGFPAGPVIGESDDSPEWTSRAKDPVNVESGHQEETGSISRGSSIETSTTRIDKGVEATEVSSVFATTSVIQPAKALASLSGESVNDNQHPPTSPNILHESSCDPEVPHNGVQVPKNAPINSSTRNEVQGIRDLKFVDVTLIQNHLDATATSPILNTMAKAGNESIGSMLADPNMSAIELIGQDPVDIAEPNACPLVNSKRAVDKNVEVKGDGVGKRKFSELQADTDGPPGKDSSPSITTFNSNETYVRPCVRREEHARKRQALQDTLFKAKTDAEALRKQVAEAEALQADAEAREIAELEKIDGEIERYTQESEALMARLRDLQER